MENTVSEALIYDSASRKKLVSDFNAARKKDAWLWATLIAAACVAAGYALFYFAGFSLLAVGGYEIGIGIVGLILWFALYYRWRGYLIGDWSHGSGGVAGEFLPAKWRQFFEDGFPIQKRLVENETVHYLYSNERTFVMICAHEAGDELRLDVESDAFTRDKLQSL